VDDVRRFSKCPTGRANFSELALSIAWDECPPATVRIGLASSSAIVPGRRPASGRVRPVALGIEPSIVRAIGPILGDQRLDISRRAWMPVVKCQVPPREAPLKARHRPANHRSRRLPPGRTRAWTTFSDCEMPRFAIASGRPVGPWVSSCSLPQRPAGFDFGHLIPDERAPAAGPGGGRSVGSEMRPAAEPGRSKLTSAGPRLVALRSCSGGGGGPSVSNEDRRRRARFPPGRRSCE
jgi:hypothetical protein